MSNNTSIIATTGFARPIAYLRLSLTDLCNYRCNYCLPNGVGHWERNTLSLEEILNLVRAFSGLGVQKVRLTGGEPTLRRDFLDIVQGIKENQNIKTLALTTNGHMLSKKIKSFKDSGINLLNVSLDSLDDDRFSLISAQKKGTGKKLIQAIDKALETGFDSVKINAVLFKDSLLEMEHWLSFIQKRDISVRFIELMKTHDNGSFFSKHHQSASGLISILQAKGFQKAVKNEKNAGPAVLYTHPDYQGSFGVIAPYSDQFCDSCNRVRVSSKGDLQLCLFGNALFSLRKYLNNESLVPKLQETLLTLLPLKPLKHHLHQGDSGTMHSFSQIGG